MKTVICKTLFWTPRVLGVLFAAFLGLFALDTLDGRQSVARTLVAFSIHLIPSALILAILALAWRREWVGAVLFAAMGTAYLATAWGRLHWSASVVISGPLFLLAGLLAWNWMKRKELRPLS